MFGNGHMLASAMGVLPDHMYAYGFASAGGPDVHRRFEAGTGSGKTVLRVA